MRQLLTYVTPTPCIAEESQLINEPDSSDLHVCLCFCAPQTHHAADGQEKDKKVAGRLLCSVAILLYSGCKTWLLVNLWRVCAHHVLLEKEAQTCCVWLFNPTFNWHSLQFNNNASNETHFSYLLSLYNRLTSTSCALCDISCRGKRRAY